MSRPDGRELSRRGIDAGLGWSTHRVARDPALWLLLLAALLGPLQALLGAAPPEVALPGTLPYLAGAGVLLAVRVSASGPSGARRWVSTIVLAGAGLSVWLVAGAVPALPDALTTPDGFYELKAAVTSPVGDHNTAAGLLLVALVAAVVRARTDRAWWIALVVVGGGLVGTLSRGATVVHVGVAVVAGVAARRCDHAGHRWVDPATARWLATSAAVVALGVGLATAVLGAATPQGAGVPDGPVGTSIAARIDLAVRGLEAGLADPVTGVGLGGFARVAGDLPAPNAHAHQLLTNAFAEGGVVLLVIAGALPVLLAWRLGRLPAGRRRELVALGGLGLVAHAQVEILGGRVGYEVRVGVLLGLASIDGEPNPATRPALSSRPAGRPPGS